MPSASSTTNDDAASWPAAVSDAQRFPRITELHYHPTTPTLEEAAAGYGAEDFEFIELRNISTTATLDLAGVRFTRGVNVDLTTGTVTSLAPPGAYLLVVRNPAAFAMHYGTGDTVTGDYGGALENAGELLRLVDAANQPIHHFSYDDDLPWPTTPDGLGPSLEAIDTGGDYNDPANWRASAVGGGTPEGVSKVVVEERSGAELWWVLY